LENFWNNCCKLPWVARDHQLVIFSTRQIAMHYAFNVDASTKRSLESDKKFFFVEWLAKGNKGKEQFLKIPLPITYLKRPD
jgi:hypothetical protein